MRKRKRTSEKLRPLHRVLCTLLRSQKKQPEPHGTRLKSNICHSRVPIYDRFIPVLYNFTYKENRAMNILEM